MMIDCLNRAKEIYKDELTDSEMEDFYNSLVSQKNMLEETGSDLAQELTKFAAQGVKSLERGLKAKLLQEITTLRAVNNIVNQIDIFEKKGIKNPVTRALLAKIGGSNLRIIGGRSSTELKMRESGITFLRNFSKDIDNELGPIWQSKKFEGQIVDALLKLNRKQENLINDPNMLRIAKIVKNYQDRNLRGQREMGVDIHELDDRVTTNIHSERRMLKLTSEEKKSAVESYPEMEKIRAYYNYARDRWKNFTLPLLDKRRVFTKNHIPLDDPQAIENFMDEVFDTLVNKGKVTQENVNVAKKLVQPRVLHWIDGESLIKYNEKFGTGSIQDSIIRELRLGFGRIEFMKDWGASPNTTLEKVMSTLEKDPTFFERPDKAKEMAKIQNLLNALTRSPAQFAGTVGEFFRNFRAFEYIAKLGMLVVKSLPDLGLLQQEAAMHGVPAFQAIGEAVRNAIVGMPKEEARALADLLKVGIEHHLGSLAKYDIEGGTNKYIDFGLQKSMWLSGAERWDNALRATNDSIVARRLAQMKKVSWDQLVKDNRETLLMYDINKTDWEIIQQSSVKIGNKKSFITPDSVQQVPDSAIMEALSKSGAKNINDVRIRQFKDNLESKLRQYFQDRADHVILRPGILDEYFLTLGFGIPQNDAARQTLKLFTQFKSYSVNFVRTPLGSALYGKGATNISEAMHFTGKGNLWGVTRLVSYMMALKYASMTIENLLLGYSPPSFDKPDTWVTMMSEAAGIYGMFTKIDPNDMIGSTAKSIAGPVFSDITKIVGAGYGLGSDLTNNLLLNNNVGYSKTWKALDKLAKSTVPKYPYSAYIWNNLIYSHIEDYANPGARQKYIDYMKQKHGAEPIF
jgi:hypothetical protein